MQPLPNGHQCSISSWKACNCSYRALADILMGSYEIIVPDFKVGAAWHFGRSMSAGFLSAGLTIISAAHEARRSFRKFVRVIIPPSKARRRFGSTALFLAVRGRANVDLRSGWVRENRPRLGKTSRSVSPIRSPPSSRGPSERGPEFLFSGRASQPSERRVSGRSCVQLVAGKHAIARIERWRTSSWGLGNNSS